MNTDSYANQTASMNPAAVAAYVAIYGPSIGSGFAMFQRGFMAAQAAQPVPADEADAPTEEQIEAAIKAGVNCGMFPKMMFIDQGAELRKQMAIVLRAARNHGGKGT